MTNGKYILLGSTFSSLILYLNRSHTTYKESKSFIESRPFGRWGVVGNLIGLGALNGAYVISHLFHSGWENSPQSFFKASFMAKSTFYPMVWVVLLKGLVNERRPGFREDRNSFPSGHATASFAFSSSVAILNGWKWGALAYALSTFVAVSRINDDYHYLHDVIFGAGLGASYAWSLYFQSLNHDTRFLVHLDHFKGDPMLTFKYQF